MRSYSKGVWSRPRVVFRRRRNMASTQDQSVADLSDSPVEEEFTEDPNEPIRPEASSAVPDLFTTLPPIQDRLATDTSRLQRGTVEKLLPYLGGRQDGLDYNDHGVPHLDRKRHANFIRKHLAGLPSAFIAADASRPWFLCWCLNALCLLGEDISQYDKGLVETARTMQNERGGFGGGFGQTSHLATTYAVVLSLATCGTEDAYEVIDRRAMWKWLCSLKQPDGGFKMSYGGEEDVR